MSTTRQSKAAQLAAEILQAAGEAGLTISAKVRHDYNRATGEWDGKAIDASVEVTGTFTPGDTAAYLAAERAALDVLARFPMVRAGSVWGTDSGSVGGHAGLTGGYVRMCKSGVGIAVARQLA